MRFEENKMQWTRPRVNMAKYFLNVKNESKSPSCEETAKTPTNGGNSKINNI